MRIAMSVLTMTTLHLALLITFVYIIAFLRMYCKIRYSGVNLPVLQALNLILLTQHFMGDNGELITTSENSGLFLIWQSLFLILSLFHLGWLFRQARAHRHNLLLPQSIREAIDFLPGGICFATPNGRPILTNHKMNELVYRLTDNTIINARITWDDLLKFNTARGCIKLDDPWLGQDHAGEVPDDCMYFSLDDGSIWRFRLEELKDRLPYYLQLQATEISDLYRYSKKLYENNLRLVETYARQQNLLANIVEINQEKEILATKMRIHDDLGRSLIITKQYLRSGTLTDNISRLIEIWVNAIKNLLDFSQISADAETSPEIELLRVAESIGCQINFKGERPMGRKSALLFYAVVREALTNAVQHAHADQLNITIKPTSLGYHVEIADNGIIPVFSVTEGSGLGNLRRRLEQEGATLEIKYENGLVLVVELPYERKNISAREA